MAGFWENLRANMANAINARQAQSSTNIPSGGTRNIEKAPTLIDENGHQKAWGFEEDKNRYSDVTDTNNPNLVTSFTWRDYTVTPKNDERKSVNFSIAYDKNGNIAGVMKRDEGEDDGDSGRVYPVVFGRDNLKKFFSQFDRDATSYRVWQNESYDDGTGTGNGQASVIFDSDEDDAPFIPSTIFKDRALAPLQYPTNDIPSPYDLPKIDVPSFYTNYRGAMQNSKKSHKA